MYSTIIQCAMTHRKIHFLNYFILLLLIHGLEFWVTTAHILAAVLDLVLTGMDGLGCNVM